MRFYLGGNARSAGESCSAADDALEGDQSSAFRQAGLATGWPRWHRDDTVGLFLGTTRKIVASDSGQHDALTF